MVGSLLDDAFRCRHEGWTRLRRDHYAESLGGISDEEVVEVFGKNVTEWLTMISKFQVPQTQVHYRYLTSWVVFHPLTHSTVKAR